MSSRGGIEMTGGEGVSHIANQENTLLGTALFGCSTPLLTFGRACTHFLSVISRPRGAKMAL